jgi:hypothetical protein
MVGNVGHPDSFIFNAVYFSKIEYDNFVVQVTFLKYDAASHSSMEIMATSTSQTSTGKGWKRVSNKISYFGNPPAYDSLRITILATNPSQHDPGTGEDKFADGTTVLLDDFRLVFKTSGINEKESKSSALVFPNPSAENFMIFLTRPVISPAQLHVFDLQGRCVYSQFIGAGTQQIPVSSIEWNPGTYIYRLSGDDITTYGRLIRLP